MVKVGNIECGFLKLTPLSRIAAIVGAVSGVTFRARKPSGMNRIRLCGVAFSAEAAPADSIVSPAHSSTSERRIEKLLKDNQAVSGPSAVGCGFSFAA